MKKQLILKEKPKPTLQLTEKKQKSKLQFKGKRYA